MVREEFEGEYFSLNVSKDNSDLINDLDSLKTID